jgi:hypothetical protein
VNAHDARPLAWYFGIPGAGKTTLATRHAAELVRRTGWPVLVVNTESVRQLAGIADAGSPRAACERVWLERRNAAFVPESQADVDYVIAQADRRGRVVLLVDEAAVWITAHDRHGAMLRLMRSHRHKRVAMLLTTQHLSGDCPQEALSCAPVLYVFNCSSGAVHDRLRERFDIDPRLVASLPRGRYIRIRTGFPDHERGQV